MTTENTNIPVFGFCCDCVNMQKSKQTRCSICGSPRLIYHKELATLSLAHIDCDAFYASIEKRDAPELSNKPVIIGGGKRGVVATACYIARIRGVHSAMPMFQALKLCPNAVVIKPNMQKYISVSKQIRQIMHELTPLVEPLSIDEAFLDLRGTEKLHRATPALTLARFAKRIENELGLTISVGLSYCKFLAKIASDMQKPRGFSMIGASEAQLFLRQQSVSLLWGVGKRFKTRLADDGIQTIDQLQQMDKAILIKRYGVMGQRLYYLSRGEDPRKVEPQQIKKNLSAETTFDHDYSQRQELAAVLRILSDKVSMQLKEAKKASHTVVLKLKTKKFELRTRNRHLVYPTQTADRIFRTGLDLLEKELDGTAFRLIGIGVQQLVDDDYADPKDLVDQHSDKRAVAENAIDKLRKKFGYKAIETGYTFKKHPSSK